MKIPLQLKLFVENDNYIKRYFYDENTVTTKDCLLRTTII